MSASSLIHSKYKRSNAKLATALDGFPFFDLPSKSKRFYRIPAPLITVV